MTVSDHEIAALYVMGFQSGAATMYGALFPSLIGASAIAAGRNLSQPLVEQLNDPGFRPRFIEAARRTLAGEPPADEVRPVRFNSTEGERA